MTKPRRQTDRRENDRQLGPSAQRRCRQGRLVAGSGTAPGGAVVAFALSAHCPDRSLRLKDERFPQFSAACGRAAGRKSAPPLAAAGGRYAIPDPLLDVPDLTSVIAMKRRSA